MNLEPATLNPPPASAAGEADAAVSGVRFVDATVAAGIRFQHVNGAAGRKHMPETYGSGGAFLDYDGDGWLDVFLVNGRPLAPAAKSPLKVQGSMLQVQGAESGRGATSNFQLATLNPPQATAALYRNNRDGTFTDVTTGSGLDVPLYGMGCCAGDYDNDGRMDLYVTCALEPGHLFHNETVPGGPPRFHDVTTVSGVGNEGKWGTSCAWLDYDRDGRLDLFIGNYVPLRRLDQDLRCERAGIRVYCGPVAYAAETNRLYRNVGGGRFADVTRTAGIARATSKALGVLVWDHNGDGWPDIMVASDQTPNLLFENTGKGTFREVGLEVGVAYGEDAIPRAGMGIDAADILNNGRLAVAVSNFSAEPISLFYPEDAGLYADVTYAAGTGEASLPLLGFGTLFVDFENSGWKGLFIANGHVEPEIARVESHLAHAQRKQLFRNRGSAPGARLRVGPAGLFEDVTAQVGPALTAPTVGRGAACGDYDNDGDLDLLVTNNAGPAELFRNDGGNRNHWLSLKLIGTRSNRDGIGATAIVRAGGITRRDWVRSGGSYLSQSDLRLHFGLGSARAAESIEIRWPSGRTTHLTDVAADRIVTVKEE